MTDYTYDPTSLNSILSGLGAGAIGAIVASLVSLPLSSPDETVANTLSVTVVSLLIGLAAGELWRRLRASNNAMRIFLWAQAGALIIALLAITIVDRTFLGQLGPYALPLAIIVFASVALLTPLLAGSHLPSWSIWLLVAVALLVGAGLLGRGNEVAATAVAIVTAQ
jgi:hypothetical protein